MMRKKLRVNLRITLLTDSMVLVVEIALRMDQGKSNNVMMSGHLVCQDFEIVGYFWSQVEANSSKAASASGSPVHLQWMQRAPWTHRIRMHRRLL